MNEVNPGSAGYISSISETDGKIAASSVSFITDVANNSESPTAPSTRAIKTYVDSCIGGMTANVAGSDAQYITCISQSNGKIEGKLATGVTSILNANDTPSFTSACNCCLVTQNAIKGLLENYLTITYNGGDYVSSISQEYGKLKATLGTWAGELGTNTTIPPRASVVYNNTVNNLSKCGANGDNTDTIQWTKGNNTSCIELTKATTGNFGVVKIGDNICCKDGVISVCPIKINYSTNTNTITKNDTCINPSCALTLHSIAHDGVSLTVSGAGNAITNITLTEGKCLSFTKATCFAVAKGNNPSCACYAGCADALKVSAAVGSATQGVYFTENGTPAKMTHCLGQDVTSSMKMICTITSPLSYAATTKSLSISLNKSASFDETDDTKPITAKAIIEYLRNRGVNIKN